LSKNGCFGRYGWDTVVIKLGCTFFSKSSNSDTELGINMVFQNSSGGLITVAFFLGF
jgi:hypothetical protein